MVSMVAGSRQPAEVCPTPTHDCPSSTHCHLHNVSPVSPHSEHIIGSAPRICPRMWMPTGTWRGKLLDQVEIHLPGPPQVSCSCLCLSRFGMMAAATALGLPGSMSWLGKSARHTSHCLCGWCEEREWCRQNFSSLDLLLT